MNKYIYISLKHIFHKFLHSQILVAYTTREKTTLERELAPLQDVNDHYPKYILTMDIDPIYRQMKITNVTEF